MSSGIGLRFAKFLDRLTGLTILRFNVRDMPEELLNIPSPVERDLARVEFSGGTVLSS